MSKVEKKKIKRQEREKMIEKEQLESKQYHGRIKHVSNYIKWYYLQ